MEYIVKSYRLGEDVIDWLEQLKAVHGSVNKGLRLAMQTAAATFPTDLMPQGTPYSRSPDLDEPLEAEREQAVDNRPKNATCRHCGVRFAGQRFATICSSCKSGGHTLTPAECPACNEGRGI